MPAMRRPGFPAALAAAAALALACGGSSGPSTPPPPPAGSAALEPDVPAWRGGCFFEGAAGKIVNGAPSWDVREYGAPCSGGAGGLVYLDAHDPVAGTGDVTVLPSTAGAKPIVVAANGGAGGLVPGGAGVRLDAARTRLLTLREVDFVTGQLLLVELASPAAPPRVLGSGVRVENYDFLADGAVLYVGNYDATTREGDLLVWNGASTPVARGISRAEFVMYRLDPARRRAAFLSGWTETGGGTLGVAGVAPPAPAQNVAAGVDRMAWSAAGALVYGVRRADGTSDLFVLDAGAAPGAQRPLATGARSWALAGETVAAVTGWSVLAGHGTFARLPLAGGAGDLSTASVAPELGAAGGSLAWVQVTDAERRAGGLHVAAAGGAGRLVDPRVAPRAGFSFSPSRALVAYAQDWSDPAALGSAAPQPGVAGAVRVVRIAGGEPFTLAAQGSMQWLAWDPLERFVGALAAFDPAANAGRLEVRDTATGALRFSAERVSPFWFDFGADGATLAAIRGWDDAMQRGELVVVPAGDLSAAPTAVSSDVTSYLPPRGGRVVYAVRGGKRDGLWLH